MKTRIFKIGSLLGCIAFLQSCAPIFSELQSARTVGKKKVELTPFFTSSAFSAEHNSATAQNQVGIHTAIGISKKLDLRIRAEYAWMTFDDLGLDETYGTMMIGFGPKFSLIQDKVTFFLPVNTQMQLQPTMLFTLPAIKDKLDLTFSPKYMMSLDGNFDNAMAYNIGMAASNHIRQWSFRCEYGILPLPGISGYLSQFSLGFSVTL